MIFFESSSRSIFLLEHDLRANASRLSRGKTGTHPASSAGQAFSGSCSRNLEKKSGDLAVAGSRFAAESSFGQKPKPRSGSPDVAVTQIRGLLGGELILALEGAQPVLGEGWHPDIVGGLEIDPVHAGRVAAEDQLLYRATGATERRKTILLLHILGDFEPTQRLDLPLGRPVPDRVGAPQDMIDPHTLDQRADQGSAEFGMRHGRVGKRRAKLGVDVGDSELLRNIREIAGPADAACGLELGPGLVGQLEERTQRRMIDDEVHLRPVLGSLADVPRGCVLPYAGEGFLVIGRQQALVDA